MKGYCTSTTNSEFIYSIFKLIISYSMKARVKYESSISTTLPSAPDEIFVIIIFGCDKPLDRGLV